MDDHWKHDNDYLLLSKALVDRFHQHSWILIFFIKNKSGTLNIAWLLSWWDYWLAFLMQTRVVRAVATKTNHGLQRLFIFVGEPELFWWRVSIASARRFLISVVYSCVLMAHSTCYFYIMWFPFAMNIHKDLIIL